MQSTTDKSPTVEKTPTIEEICYDVARLQTSLDSISKFKKGIKYYYEETDGCFYGSAEVAKGFCEATIGAGILSNLCVATSRYFCDQDSFKLAKDLGTRNSDLKKLIDNIEKVALNADIKPLHREALHEKVKGLHEKSLTARKGLEELKETYSAQLDKQQPFLRVIQTFKKVQDKMEKVANKINDAIITHRNREDLLKRQNEQLYSVDERLNRRSVSNHKRGYKTSATRMSGGLLPLELTRIAMENIFRVYMEYEKSSKPVLVMPHEDKRLCRPLVIFEKKTFILLNKESHLPNVQTAMVFENRKIAMYIHNIATNALDNQRAEHQLSLMERYKKTDGIVRMKDMMTHLSFDEEDGNRLNQYIFIRNYDQGSLSHCIKRHLLSEREKCQVILDVMEGLRALHNDGYIVRALHPETIAVEKQSRKAKKKGVAGAIIGLEHVVSEEEGGGWTKATDMRLLGQIMNALFFRYFNDQKDFSLALQNVMNGEPLLEPPKFKKKRPLKELILSLCSIEEENRPTIDEAIKVLNRYMLAEKKSESLIDGISESSERAV